MSLVIGVDSSTQSCKVEAREIETGTVVATGKAAHPATSPPVSEQDPEAWWSALVEAFEPIGDHRADVVAMSVAGQQHGLVLIGADARPLRPAKLWNDTSSAPEAASLVDRLGARAWARACGSVPVAAFTVSKLAWVATHEPEALDRASLVLLPHDYLTWRLTDRAVTDRGDASGTGWFDPRGGDYLPDLIGAAGVAPELTERLPEVLRPDEAAGVITAAAARKLGLPPTVVVGPGTGDNMAAALGLGLAPGDLAMSLGTSGTVYAVSSTPTADPTGAVAGFADATGRYLPLICTLNATRVTDTVAGWLGTDPAGLAAMALDADRGTEAPTLVPWFDGERTPNRPDATGTFVGLRTATTREDLALAAHEGVLCGLFGGVDALRTAGVEVDGRLHLVGGGARSGAYQRACADLHGRRIVVPESDEAVAAGAALQAATVWAGDAEPTARARAWGLGDGTTVEPVDPSRGAERRAAYRALTRSGRPDSLRTTP